MEREPLPENWREIPSPCGWFHECFLTEKVHIVAAANRLEVTAGEFVTFVSARHFSPSMAGQIKAAGLTERGHDMEQGFIDQHDRFWNREQAAEIVFLMQQDIVDFRTEKPTKKHVGVLFSENLY